VVLKTRSHPSTRGSERSTALRTSERSTSCVPIARTRLTHRIPADDGQKPRVAVDRPTSVEIGLPPEFGYCAPATQKGNLPDLRLTEAADGAKFINAGGEDPFWRYGLAIGLCQIDLLSHPKDSALAGLYIGRYSP